MDPNPSSLHSLEVALANLSPLPQSAAYLNRVPRELRVGNEHHYTPTTVSIGPFHAAHPNLDAAYGRLLKHRALNHMLSRSQITLSSLFQLLKGLEEEARLCYGETGDLSSDDFVQMMLLDGCFILALHTSDYQMPLDRVRGLLIEIIQRDLLVIENQLPFFVLEVLFTHFYQFFSEWFGMTFRKHALNFIEPVLPIPLILSEESTTPPPRHLLELVLLTLLPRQPTPPNRTISDFKIRKMSLLVRHGVVPMPRKPNTSVIKFSSNGCLEIQPMYIQEFTTTFFKNLLALEMCSVAQTKSCFMSYISFMVELVDTNKDVDILFRGRVVKAKFKNQDALASHLSDLTSSMGFYRDEYFTFVYQDLEEYLGRWRAKLYYLLTPRKL